jgi:hypothetical protein
VCDEPSTSELFYDRSIGLEEKARRLRERADGGGEEARGYLESIQMLRHASAGGSVSRREGASPTLACVVALEASIPRVAKGLEVASSPPRESSLEAELVEQMNRELPTGLVAVKQRELLLAGWPGVGPVDLAVPITGVAPVLVELKWGRGALFNCAWDALKLATALAEGATHKAFLLAGAPASEWASGPAGSEFFGEDAEDWDVREFMSRHASGFKKWRREVRTRPRRVPDNFSSDPAGGWKLVVGGEPWELRWCELMLTLTSGWVEVDDEGRLSLSPGGAAPVMQSERLGSRGQR